MVVIPGNVLYPPPPSVIVISSILPYALVEMVLNFKFEVDAVYEPDSG